MVWKKTKVVSKKTVNWSPIICKVCHNAKCKQWRIDNPEKYAKQYIKNSTSKKQRVEALKTEINKIKERGCSHCGFNRFPESLEFHHTDPTIKDVAISTMIHKAKKIDTILKEIEKCIVLCANCHIAFHNGDIKL